MKDMIKKITKRDLLIGVSCFVVGAMLMTIVWPKRIAELKNGEEVAIKLKNGVITADDIYSGLKEKYAISQLFESVDKMILEDKYELTKEDKEKVEENANYYFEMYENNYQMSKEDFLKQNGFENEKEFTKYLELDYMRNLYYEDYFKTLVKKDDIEKYYEESVFEPFNVEHVLVKTSDTVTSEQAKEKANEILNKLKNGTSWEDIKNTYKDEITTESFAVEFDSNFEESFTTAAKALKDGEYSGLVETSYGYHIINRISTMDKLTVKELNDRIEAVIIKDLKTKEEYAYQLVLDFMRSEAKMQIKDKELKKAYKKYLDSLK